MFQRVREEAECAHLRHLGVIRRKKSFVAEPMNSPDELRPDDAAVASSAQGAGAILWEGALPSGIRFRWRDGLFLGLLLGVAALTWGGRPDDKAKRRRSDNPPGFVFVAGLAGYLIFWLRIEPSIRRGIRFVLTESHFTVDADLLGGTVRSWELRTVRDVTMWRHADDSGKLVVSVLRPTSQYSQSAADKILDVMLWAPGGGRFNDVVVGIEVGRGLKALHERFVEAVRRARGSDAPSKESVSE